jgi:hypothetical protein
VISLRIVAGAALGAAVAGYAVGVLTREPALDPPVASALEPAPGAQPGEPLPPAAFAGADRPRVPAGILARAANARALHRAPYCPSEPPADEPPRCAPEPRDPVEIEWHVAPADP